MWKSEGLVAATRVSTTCMGPLHDMVKESSCVMGSGYLRAGLCRVLFLHES